MDDQMPDFSKMTMDEVDDYYLRQQWHIYGDKPVEEKKGLRAFFCLHEKNDANSPRRVDKYYSDIDHSQCRKCGHWFQSDSAHRKGGAMSVLNHMAGGSYKAPGSKE